MPTPNNPYTIIETDSGPMISDSRVYVYDILEGEEAGMGFWQLCVVYGVNPQQAEVALAYTHEHRDSLLRVLPELQAKKREREAYYRAIVNKIRTESSSSDSFEKQVAELRRKQALENKKPQPLYPIVESENGILISDSNISVFDILEGQQAGMDMWQLCVVHGLIPPQVESALTYITEHHEELLHDFPQYQTKKQERSMVNQ